MHIAARPGERIMARLIAIACCCLLCACTTAQDMMQETAQGTLKSVESKYIGQKAERFWVAKGPPAGSQYRKSDGGTIYTWIGDAKGYSVPFTTVNARLTSIGGATGTATTRGGGAVVISCSLELHADYQDVVRVIRVAEDTIGARQTSRCAEILSK
jgi:hypothetical protein